MIFSFEIKAKSILKAVASIIIILFFLIGCGEVNYQQYEPVESNRSTPIAQTTNDIHTEPIDETITEESTANAVRDYRSQFINTHKCSQIIDNELYGSAMTTNSRLPKA